MKRIPLTAIILTHDEEVNIRKCLAALERVDDVVIVDSGSRDRTLEFARTVAPRARILSNEFADFGQQRNWAIDHSCSIHQWILFVDADEFCDPELLEEISNLLADPGDLVGAYVAGRNYFMGQWLKRSTMFPSYQLRLLKIGYVRFRKEGHGQREVTEGPLKYLRTGWHHEGFSKGVAQWIARHNRYSTEEVERIIRDRAQRVNWGRLFGRDRMARRRVLKQLATRLPARTLWRFFYTYLFKGGFMDGRAGLHYCLLRWAHDLHISVKIREYLLRNSREETGAQE